VGTDDGGGTEGWPTAQSNRMIIAATAAAHSCVVVTANERHFDGVIEFLNPLQV